jgi:hypothetical protein
MRLTTSHRRPANRRIAVPVSKPRNPVVQAVVNGFGTMTGKRHRDAERARERFERLDFDQRVREIGEW